MKKIGLSLCLVFSLGFLKVYEVSVEEIVDIFYKFNVKEFKMKINYMKGFCVKGVFFFNL